jgi:uncharacterized damage-inducible protein DinB
MMRPYQALHAPVSVERQHRRSVKERARPGYSSGVSALAADDAAFLLHRVGLPAFRAEHPLTAAVIAAIPPQAGEYRPHADSRTALALSWHIVSAEIKYLEAIAAGVFPHELWPAPDAVRAPSDVLAWYQERFTPAVNRLEQTTGDELLRVIDFYGLRKFPAVGLIQIILNHTIHHRGQLSTYLRPMGARVPSIYGPSFDAGGFAGGTRTAASR